MAICSNCQVPTSPLVATLTRGLCLRCKAKWRHFSRTQGVRANQAAWSPQSQRSRAFEPGAAIWYHDEYYWCTKCGSPSVFTAAQQQHAYEIEKRYIYSTRTLCDRCYSRSKAERDKQRARA